jgi:acetyl-CoA acetyltransferase
MSPRDAVISGVGISEVGRRLHRDPLVLTARAALSAIADAGLTPKDIDGISTYPGAIGSSPGFSGAGIDDVTAMLGLKTRWVSGGLELPGQLGSVVNAVIAVGYGLVEHVLCFRTVWESSAQDRRGGRSATLQQGLELAHRQWTDPYGCGYPTRGALWMQRYMHETGATRAQLGQIAVTCRANAALNPSAVYRAPLSLEDYLDARMISDPLCLYDCDVPVDGAIALVVSRADAGDLAADKAVKVASVGSAAGMAECAAMLWSGTTLEPSDVRLAELYDGFSILTVMWLEALGLCEPGGAARFIEGGERIARTGALPINTGGGQLSQGRLHGYGHLYNACLQLRGEAGERQVRPFPEVAAVSSGVSSFSSCLLLAKG